MTDENMKTEDMMEETAAEDAVEKPSEETASQESVEEQTEKESGEEASEESEVSAEEGEDETSSETDEDEEDSESKSDSGEKKDKKLRWKKKDKKDEKIEELTDRLQRTMAEFDNYRKRTDKEKASMYIIGAKEVVEKILPIIDNFERGLASATEEQKADPFVEGFDKIYKQLCKTLEDMGVKVIEAVGKEFDPNFHNAVMHVDDESVGENIVVEEFQKGYLYKDFVVRHSMVKVAN